MARFSTLLTVIAAVLLLFSLSFQARAVTGKKRVVLIKTMPVPAVMNHSRWFVNGLKDLGYISGETLDLIEFQADGDRQRAENFLSKMLLTQKPDLVVSSATLASQAAYKVLKNKGIPLIFMTVSDPVGAGIVEKLGVASGEFVTGRVHELNRLTVLDAVVNLVGQKKTGEVTKFGIIASSYPSSQGEIVKLREIDLQRDDVSFFIKTIPYQKVPQGLPAMLEDVKKNIRLLENQINYWWEVSGPLAESPAFTELLQKNSKKKIALGVTMRSAEQGVLLVLTPNEKGTGLEVARLAKAILNGADPGKIPVVAPSAFDLGINLTTALNLDVIVPSDMLKLAGKNIYR